MDHVTLFPPGSTCLLNDPAFYTAPVPAIVLDSTNPLHIARWGTLVVEEAVANAQALHAVAVWIAQTRSIRRDKASDADLVHGRPERISIVLPESLMLVPKPPSRDQVVKKAA
jgi:hypothetical protein